MTHPNNDRAHGSYGELQVPGAGEDWRARGNCVDLAPSLFYPGRGDTKSVKEAKAVCAGCEVRETCLEFALINCVRTGIWGGKSERERREMRRQRAADTG